jgi:kinesin family protein 3/17
LQKVREKAEEDKREVMAAYEQRSREFFKEREDRKRLEEKINALESQVLVGGHKMEDTP